MRIRRFALSWKGNPSFNRVEQILREDVQAHYEKWQTTWNRSYARDRMARMTKHVFPTLARLRGFAPRNLDFGPD
jgi:hypothetical protein